MIFEKSYFDMGRLDRLSYHDTFVHRLDPRVKVIVTILFLLTVISFPKYEVVSLIPFFLFPVMLATIGEIPIRFILGKLILVSPFAIMIGIFNPILDTKIISIIYGIPISAGLMSFISILLKFALTVSAALLLIATTSFPGVCHALRKMGFPAIFVTQLLFLYRYIFVLMGEAMRMIRAIDMRSFGTRSMEVKVFSRLIGTLLFRTIDRAERVYCAILSRGFEGDIPTVKKNQFNAVDIEYLLLTIIFLGIFRFFRVSESIGIITQELLR